VIVGHHPHVLQAVETYRTHEIPAGADGKPGEPGRETVIFYSLGNFLSNQSRTYVEGLMPDATGDPRDALIGLFSAVRRDYGPAGVRVELGHVGILPVWGENNRNQIASGHAKTAQIRPVLIDREIPKLQARLDELTKPSAAELSAEEKKEFVTLTTQLKLLTDRRVQILARTGDEYLTAPPKLVKKDSGH
jgi:poly-gamma-glutamate synthesis protein (capsule biosynthesis protein)